MTLVFASFSNAELPLLYISRMVRPGGRGRGGDTPPPPEYMAGMIQQFELNRQFMENMMAQFPRPDMNQQPTPVTLQDFMRLNPTIYRTSTQPLDADDWLRDITYEMESADVAPAGYVSFASFFLKGPAAQCGTATGVLYQVEQSSPGQTSKLLSVPASFLRESWTERSVNFAASPRATRLWKLISGSFWTCPAMLKRTLQLMLVDRRNSEMDSKLTSYSHCWYMTLTISLPW